MSEEELITSVQLTGQLDKLVARVGHKCAQIGRLD